MVLAAELAQAPSRRTNPWEDMCIIDQAELWEEAWVGEEVAPTAMEYGHSLPPLQRMAPDLGGIKCPHDSGHDRALRHLRGP